MNKTLAAFATAATFASTAFASALVVDADRYFSFLRMPGMHGTTQVMLLSKHPCKARGGNGWRHAYFLSEEQGISGDFCWRDDQAKPKTATEICMVNESTGKLETSNESFPWCSKYITELFRPTTELRKR